MAITREKPRGIKQLSRRPSHVRILVYSYPGVGKSVLAGSSAEVGKTLILNADGPDGPESMRAMGYDPDVYDVKSFKELDEAYEYLRHGGREEYDWVWLDSITLFQELGMDQIMAELVKKSPHRDINLPDKPQYLLTQNKLGLWIRRMKGLPMNFGMTAHVMKIGTDDDDEEESGVQYMPAIQGGQGNMSSKICGYVGIVGRMYIHRKRVAPKGGGRPVVRRTRVLQAQPSGKWYAKDRFAALGTELVNPTMAQIVESINRRKS
jgi:hypothetical protein